MWKFVGKEGEFMPGIPARDLTDEEAKEWPAEVEESPLYEKVTRAGRPGKQEGSK